MPGMDGVETLAHLKQIAPDVRVIVMSGYSPAEVKRKFDEPAVIGFIPKPFELTQVKAELARVFAQPG
jgi:two-component system cell cycle sensor histidine kinase/response regulator CckA